MNGVVKMSVFDDLASYSPNIRNGSSTKDVLSEDKVEDLILKLEREGFNLEEMKPILYENGNQLIISGAGSGKTTILLFVVQKDILTGEATKLVQLPNSTEPTRVMDNVLVCTFLSSGADDLKSRLGYWQNKFGYTNNSDSIVFSTLHAEFLKVLRIVGVNQGTLTNIEMRRITKKVCESYGITNAKTGYMSKEDYRNIEGIFTYARNRLDDKRYENANMEMYNITPVILDNMLQEAKTLRRSINKIDFEDMQELLLQALRSNQALQDLVASRYSIMYIDEFQDTSQIQYEILKYYAKGCKRIVAIGDDDQTIYTWRGSDINIIREEFQKDFNPTLYKLTVNYRCPENILKPVVDSICLNNNRYDKELKSYLKGGELNAYYMKNIEEYWDLLNRGIEQDILSSRTISILVRTNFDGLVPAMLLEAHHVYDYSISSDSMTADKKLPQDILGLVSLFLDRDTNRLRNSLDLIAGKNWEAKRDNKALMDVISSNYRLNIWNVDKNDLRASAPDTYNLLKSLESAKNSPEPNAEIIAFIRLLQYVEYEIYGDNNDYCNGARNFIQCLYKIIEMKDFKTVEEFDTYMVYLNKELSAHIGKQNTKIQIATVHEAKGKEWDSVYIWNDVRGIFPSTRIDESDNETWEEERRVHYIAWTRAKKKLTVLSQLGNESEFLRECSIPEVSEKFCTDIVSKQAYEVEDLFS